MRDEFHAVLLFFYVYVCVHVRNSASFISLVFGMVNIFQVIII